MYAKIRPVAELININLKMCPKCIAFPPFSFLCGWRRICTYEGRSQQIYSLPQLAALVSTRIQRLTIFIC